MRVMDKPWCGCPRAIPVPLDRFASDVTVAGRRLYLGTHDGRVLCLEAADGRTIWQAASKTACWPRPRCTEDGSIRQLRRPVYALEAETGRERWAQNRQVRGLHPGPRRRPRDRGEPQL